MCNYFTAQCTPHKDYIVAPAAVSLKVMYPTTLSGNVLHNKPGRLNQLSTLPGGILSTTLTPDVSSQQMQYSLD